LPPEVVLRQHAVLVAVEAVELAVEVLGDFLLLDPAVPVGVETEQTLKWQTFNDLNGYGVLGSTAAHPVIVGLPLPPPPPPPGGPWMPIMNIR
jgi:hypothetical protein